MTQFESTVKGNLKNVSLYQLRLAHQRKQLKGLICEQTKLAQIMPSGAVLKKMPPENFQDYTKSDKPQGKMKE